MQNKKTFTVKEAASYIGVSLPIMYDITERADFHPLLRINRKKLILVDRFDQWIEEQADSQKAQ